MMRAQCQELDQTKQRLGGVMGFLMAAQDTRGELDYNVTHRNTKERERFRGSYYHAGYKGITLFMHVIIDNFRNTVQVCRKTFLFLHSIGANQFKLIKKIIHYKWTNTQVLK